MKRIEPTCLTATIPQPRSCRRRHGRKQWQISLIARCPEIRNKLHPITSGAQIRRFCPCVVSPSRKESVRLMLNASVPTNGTKVESQSTFLKLRAVAKQADSRLNIRQPLG